MEMVALCACVSVGVCAMASGVASDAYQNVGIHSQGICN